MSRNAFDCLHVYLQLFRRGMIIDNVQKHRSIPDIFISHNKLYTLISFNYITSFI